MDFIKSVFVRDFETALDIEQLDVNRILQIPPDKISTKKIIADELFQHIDPAKQAAVKYIAEQKHLRDEFGIPYPAAEKIVKMFSIRQSSNRDVNDVISTEGFSDLDNRVAANNMFRNLAETPKRKMGGKKRSRKKRKQSRRKRR